MFDMVDALITDAFEIFDAETDLFVGVEKLLCAAAGIPLGLKFWQQGLNAAEINFVAALVWACIPSEIDLAIRHGLFDNPRDIADLVILVAATDVERLVVNALAGGVKNSDERPRNVFDMHERTPGSAIALEIDASRGDSPCYEVVNHQVEAQTRRDAVSGSIPHVSRTER